MNIRKLLLTFNLLTSAVLLNAQEFAPGFLDPEPILSAAEEAIGTKKLKCVTIAGEAYAGMVGQAYLNGYQVDWPRDQPLKNYQRTMNWESGYMVESFERDPGRNPASWKYGLGWRGGTPLQKHRRQSFYVKEGFGWHTDGPNGAPVAAHPVDAERWQLDLWMNPHGFLKAARLLGANPQATWRWELGEMGRDGATTQPEKVWIVSITILGKFRVDATINKENLLQRIHTWVPDPVLGDMNFEQEFASETYVDLGNGIRFPNKWHRHTGWDDNYQIQSITTGHNDFGGILDEISANDCGDAIEVPDSVRDTSFEVKVETQKLADGVWLLGGSSHNSVAIEFEKFVVVVEAPLDELRNLAVIDEIVRLVPDKPIRFVVNTHQHHDHIGGLRTYLHIGATIITHWENYEFYTRDVLNYAPRTLQPDMVSLWPPTELAEGYQYETVRENYWLKDNSRSMHISYVHPLKHVQGMLIAYLPEEKIVIEADLYDPPGPGQTPPTEPNASNISFYNHAKRLELDVETVVPIHGQPVPWKKFVDFLRKDP
ncbi:MAG: hypothetical protein CMI18_05405 [Opitutaceae bacterium]|nr:hypothetical protein [Opitutaceae bacterium]